jgi:hypothetical protein
MKNTTKKKNNVTLKESIAKAAEWKNSKRSAQSFVDRYPMMGDKILFARAIPSGDKKIANWVRNNAH